MDSAHSLAQQVGPTKADAGVYVYHRGVYDRCPGRACGRCHVAQDPRYPIGQVIVTTDPGLEVLHLHVVDETADDSEPESLVPAQVDAVNPVVVPREVCQVEGELAVGVGGPAAHGVGNLDGEGFGVLDEPQLDGRRGCVGQIETHGERARLAHCKLDLVEHVVGHARPPGNGSGDEAGGPDVLR